MKDILIYVFTKNNVFSWRAALTAIGGFIFTFACIGNLFGLPELPKSYQIIIGGIFGFYFSKELINKIRVDKE